MRCISAYQEGAYCESAWTIDPGLAPEVADTQWVKPKKVAPIGAISDSAGEGIRGNQNLLAMVGCLHKLRTLDYLQTCKVSCISSKSAVLPKTMLFA
jgi:hypothetical protein